MRISDWSSDVCSSDLAGEVLGLAGTLGSGRSELLHAIFGADPAATGTVLLDGTPVGRWPDEAVAAGIALVPEDRASQGYVPWLTLAEHIPFPRPPGSFLDADDGRGRGAVATTRSPRTPPAHHVLPCDVLSGT